MLRIWEVASSGPSRSWVYQLSRSGTRRSMKVSRSARAVGSQFSLRTREALVCGRKRKHIPSSTLQSHNCTRSVSVISCSPLPRVAISSVVLYQFILRIFCRRHELANDQGCTEESQSQYSSNPGQDPHQRRTAKGFDTRLQRTVWVVENRHFLPYFMGRGRTTFVHLHRVSVSITRDKVHNRVIIVLKNPILLVDIFTALNDFHDPAWSIFLFVDF